MSSKIEYLNFPGFSPETWNPFTGCQPDFECWHRCWARKRAEYWLRGKSGYPADEPFRPTWHADKLLQPTRWQKPRCIDVCFMGDIALASPVQIQCVYAVMAACRRHLFVVCTKRPHTLRLKLLREWGCGHIRNVIHLTSVSMEMEMRRWRSLSEFWCDGWECLGLSVEPLLGRISLPVGDGKPDWVIVGGESGPGCRTMELEHARDVLAQCRELGVPFFMKQLGGHPHKRSKLEDLPEDLRVREFPKLNEELSDEQGTL